MPHINLLPWREEERRRKQKEFINIAVGAAVVMLGIIALVHININGTIDTQERRNKYLTEEINRVDGEIAEIKALESEKKALLARMNIIQQLQSSRPGIVHLFDEIAKTIPEKAFLIQASRKGSTLNFSGIADSNDYVSQFMRALNESPWFANPKLLVIETGKSEYADASNFQLEVAQADPTAKVDGKEKK
jgi:type IV pilus assembly protein PilN